MELGTALRKLRKIEGITQGELSDKTELSVNAISQIERNQTFPQADNIKKICVALNVPVAYALVLSVTDEDLPPENKNLIEYHIRHIQSLIFKD